MDRALQLLKDSEIQRIIKEASDMQKAAREREEAARKREFRLAERERGGLLYDIPSLCDKLTQIRELSHWIRLPRVSTTSQPQAISHIGPIAHSAHEMSHYLDLAIRPSSRLARYR